MLTWIELIDWKSFGSFGATKGARNQLHLAPLTLLVGPNGSGKSNLIDGLRFLQGAALDLPLGDVLRGRWEGQREVWPAIRGHVAEAARVGTDRFLIRTCWRFEDCYTGHSLVVDTGGDVGVAREDLLASEDGTFQSPGDTLFDTHAAALKGMKGMAEGGGVRVAMRPSGKGNRVTATYTAQRSLLGQIEPKPRVHPDVISRAHQVRDALRGATFLDIRPAQMRDYRPMNGGHLGTSGENISPVLYSLGQQGRLEDVVDWLSELCAPVIERIDFDQTQLREVMMFLVEKGGRKVSARSISDGTLRFLGELVALLTCPEGSLVVIEEPDVGLHPSRIHLLAQLLEQIVERRKIQVIATTHSPTLLANLSEKVLGDVVAFGRDPETGWTVCSRLQDLPHWGSLKSSKELEHLISTGWLERAL